MKKADICIIFAVLFVAITLLFLGSLGKTAGKTVVISQNNICLYKVDLNKDTVITLEGNTIEIKSQRVRVVKADCKNQICVKHKAISKSGESIVCLPNKVLIEIK